MQIEKIFELTQEVFDAVRRLVPLLGAHKPIPTWNDLSLLVNSGISILLIARLEESDSPIVGMLTISLYRVPTGRRSIVEDLVVDANFRNKGIARALLLSAIGIGREAGVNGVALTSNPERIEANQLYVSMGFKKRDTNAYFYELK